MDFHQNVLGQRFLKKMVIFDVTDTYHLYYADEVSTLGTSVAVVAFQPVL